jgi:hypothetical protein
LALTTAEDIGIVAHTTIEIIASGVAAEGVGAVAAEEVVVVAAAG